MIILITGASHTGKNVLAQKLLEKYKIAVQKALDETQLLFDSLMQKYFG